MYGTYLLKLLAKEESEGEGNSGKIPGPARTPTLAQERLGHERSQGGEETAIA
jgi:hypothetical protein